VRWGVVVGLGLFAASGAAALYRSRAADPGPPPPSPTQTALVQGKTPRLPERTAPPVPDDVGDAVSSALPVTAAPAPETEPARSEPARPPRRTDPPARPPRNPAPSAPAERVFRLVPTHIKNAKYSIDGGPFQQIESGAADVSVGPGAHKIVVRNELCDDYVVKIEAGEAAHQLNAPLAFKMTQVRVHCPQATAISINGKTAVNDATVDIPFQQSSRQTVEIEFLINGQTQTRNVPVVAAGPLTEVKCDGP
jgi:hypothetical protein